MAKLVRLESGLLTHRLNDNEQNAIWNEVNKDVNPVGKHHLFTPQDNLKYFIISEVETSFQNYEALIEANNKQIKVKYNICNQDEKINKIVRKAYHS